MAKPHNEFCWNPEYPNNDSRGAIQLPVNYPALAWRGFVAPRFLY